MLKELIINENTILLCVSNLEWEARKIKVVNRLALMHKVSRRSHLSNLVLRALLAGLRCENSPLTHKKIEWQNVENAQTAKELLARTARHAVLLLRFVLATFVAVSSQRIAHQGFSPCRSVQSRG
jgi:hypothetical protein